ncbi:MAG: hypothetical protein JXA77_11230 [Bacteroidales bacterium]|nr:hypothetical protein [Bacteroidales bacterium]MBN2819065.1 hypothetical protein [Bacteroidales bacterium]
MKQMTLIFFVIISLNSYSQNDSRGWLNLNGEIKSLRQVKYNISDDNLIQISSDKRRFGDVLFMSFGQQLLIDNTFIRFSKSGMIEYWTELDDLNDTILTLKFFYDNALLPSKIEFIRGENVGMTASYVIDNSGNFVGVNMDNISSLIQRDKDMRVISETLTRDSDTTKLTYKYHDDGTVDIQMFDGDELMYSISNKFNQNGDFEFDGRFNFQYTFDNFGNWITKTGFLDETPVIKYIREIEYY